MAAHVEVVSTDLRRVKVKVTPGTYLVDVLGEACRKLNLTSDKYELKYVRPNPTPGYAQQLTYFHRHKQKLVDLTGPWRTSGLSPGAKLELVQKSKSASVVSIALDVDGKRYTSKLPSDLSLWKVMRQFESTESGLHITARGEPVGTNSGQLYHNAPVVNIMGREYSALEDLQKTLSQCGVNSGSIVLRVTFKLSERTLYDALQIIAQYLNEVESEQPRADETKPLQLPIDEQLKSDVPMEDAPDLVAPVPTTTEEPTPTLPAGPSPKVVTMDVDVPSPAPAPAGPTGPTDPLQPTGVFSAPTSSTPAATRIHEPDSVFEPTIAHAQLRQHQLVQRGQNTRLKSDAELAADAAQEAAKLAKITSVDVKVRFPDQTSAVWTITPDETAAFLYNAIRNVMAHPTQPFKLILPGPKTAVLDDDKKLIAGYRLKGREVVQLLWLDAVKGPARSEAFLKDSVASKAKELVVPDVSQLAGVETGGPAAGPSSVDGPAQQERGKGGSNMDSEAMKKKLSKFLGLGKKK